MNCCRSRCQPEPKPKVSNPQKEPPSETRGAEGALAKSGLTRGVAAGLSGEQISARGVLDAIGGVRGIIETLLPGLLYLVLFILTEDARLSVIAPAVIAVGAFVVRVLARQPVVSALSGVLGVAICVLTTLFTGKGEDYFLPGFWINAIWSIALIVSLLVRWPLLGFLVGVLRNDITGWRRDSGVRFAATVASLIWLTMFVLRLAVQLPLYFSGEVASLGLARLVMGTPLFALVILFTWMLFRKTLSAEAGTHKS